MFYVKTSVRFAHISRASQQIVCREKCFGGLQGETELI